jgi:hypothetical protein
VDEEAGGKVEDNAEPVHVRRKWKVVEHISSSAELEILGQA